MHERTAPPPALDAAIAYSPKDAAIVTGLSRTTLYKLIGEGRLELRKVGTRSLIPAASLRALIEGEAA